MKVYFHGDRIVMADTFFFKIKSKSLQRKIKDPKPLSKSENTAWLSLLDCSMFVCVCVCVCVCKEGVEREREREGVCRGEIKFVCVCVCARVCTRVLSYYIRDSFFTCYLLCLYICVHIIMCVLCVPVACR